MTPLRQAALDLANAFADHVEARGPVHPERLLTYEQVAERLGVHVDTARRRGRMGAWPERMPEGGGDVRVLESDLTEYMRGLRTRLPRVARKLTVVAK